LIKIKILGVIVLALVIFLAVFLFIVGFFKSKKAALRIESSPTSSIYLDNVQVGQTPFETTWDSGEVVLKIVPQSSNLAFYETKIFLTSGVRTVVRWFFGESQETSMGEIISFEKTSSDEVSISVVSEPDGAQVSLDSN
jgi:hypothetical protein